MPPIVEERLEDPRGEERLGEERLGEERLGEERLEAGVGGGHNGREQGDSHNTMDRVLEHLSDGAARVEGVIQIPKAIVHGVLVEPIKAGLEAIGATDPVTHNDTAYGDAARDWTDKNIPVVGGAIGRVAGEITDGVVNGWKMIRHGNGARDAYLKRAADHGTDVADTAVADRDGFKLTGNGGLTAEGRTLIAGAVRDVPQYRNLHGSMNEDDYMYAVQYIQNRRLGNYTRGIRPENIDDTTIRAIQADYRMNQQAGLIDSNGTPIELIAPVGLSNGARVPGHAGRSDSGAGGGGAGSGRSGARDVYTGSETDRPVSGKPQLTIDNISKGRTSFRAADIWTTDPGQSPRCGLDTWTDIANKINAFEAKAYDDKDRPAPLPNSAAKLLEALGGDPNTGDVPDAAAAKFVKELDARIKEGQKRAGFTGKQVDGAIGKNTAREFAKIAKDGLPVIAPVVVEGPAVDGGTDAEAARLAPLVSAPASPRPAVPATEKKGGKSEDVDIAGLKRAASDLKRNAAQLDAEESRLTAELLGDNGKIAARAKSSNIIGQALQNLQGTEVVSAKLVASIQEAARKLGKDQADYLKALPEYMLALAKKGAGEKAFDEVALTRGEQLIARVDSRINRLQNLIERLPGDLKDEGMKMMSAITDHTHAVAEYERARAVLIRSSNKG